MKPRTIRTTNVFGRTLVHVPLARNGDQEAVLWKEDWKQLLELGVSLNWCLISNSVVSRGAGKQVLIARILLDLKPGERVIYRDGSGLNLRRENLGRQEKGWSVHHHRDHLLNAALERLGQQ